jgi:hypothetical protein
MSTFIKMESAAELPGSWDGLAEHYFQQRKFLLHAERYNPCNQRYYLGLNEGVTTSAAIVYTLQLDLLTYLKIKSPLKMHLVGIPCSVSSSGIFGEHESVEALKLHIIEKEKGFLVFLNLTEKPADHDRATGCTLPTIFLSNRFADWKSYENALRTGYRRRLKQINASDPTLRLEKMTCSSFTTLLYDQYLEVYQRSDGKLEKLSFDFFRNLPEEFILTACYKNEALIGWNLALEHQGTYYFFLGGIHYKQNKANNTYLRLLAQLVRDGIEKHAKIIELGQTAEIAKMRMGGLPETLYMQAHHSNRFFNRLLLIAGPLLAYKRKLENTNAFKPSP